VNARRSERLKHLASVAVSNVDKKSVDGEVSVQLCNYTDVYYNDTITADLAFMAATATPDQVDRFSLRAGDVIITKDSETAADIAVSAFVAEDLPGVVCGYHLAVVRPGRGIDPRYLYWCFESSRLRESLSVEATGVTRFGLRSESIANVAVPVTDVTAQLSIANFLDSETARIDALGASRLAMLPLLKERLTAAVDHALTAVNGRVTPLMRLVPDDRQIMYGIVLPGPNVEDGVPIVKGGDVGAGRLHPDVLAKTTQEIEAPFARARLRRGDVLVAIRGSIGEGALVPPALDGANITQDVARVSPRAGIESSWLLYALASTQAAAQMASRTTGATIRGLNIWDLERITVPVPSAEDQRHVAVRLNARCASYERSRTLLTEQIELLREHRQALITAAVTGEIDVTRKAS